MNKKVEELLNRLREAVHDAIVESQHVAEAMAELEKAQCCPSFFEDISLAEPSPMGGEDRPFTEALVFTEYDEQFLRAMKVTSVA